MSSRQDYLDFLRDKRLNESDVLPIWPEGFEETKKGIMVDLLTLLRQGTVSPDAAKHVIDALQNNTNDLLQVMDKHLREELGRVGIRNIPRAYVGVFPTNSFNGQAVNYTNGPLILLKTGLIELIEAASNFLLAERDTKERVVLLSDLIVNFCEEGAVPSTKSIDHPSFRGEAQKTGISLVTQAEFFVLCHEYGHLANHHFDKNVSEKLNTQKGPVDVFANVRKKEIEADLWAVQTNIKLASQTNVPLSQVRCGILFFFCLALLIEKYLKRLGAHSDGHPTAIERISHAEKFLVIYGANDNQMWNFITTAHLSFFNLVHNKLFGTTLPWQEMSLKPPSF